MGETTYFGEFPGELISLIALPPLLTPPVQRNRDQDGIAIVLKSFVFLEGLLHETSEVASQKKLAAVFDSVDKMKGGFQSLEGCSGEVEIMGKPKTVLTTEFLVKTAVKDFTAVPAKGGFNAGELIRAILAK